MRMKRFYLAVVMLAFVATDSPCRQLEISGFVDATWVWNTADHQGEFGVEKVELGLRHHVSERTFVRTDLEWLKDGEDVVAQVEQAYVQYTTRGGWSFTFGRYNTPFGFEEYDAPDLYQYSSSLLDEHALPGNFAGFAVGRDLGRGLSLTVYGSNGWDRNVQAGGNLTWAGRLEYARSGFTGGLSGISGKEDGVIEDASLTRSVVDLDLGYEGRNWVFGADYNQGKATLTGGIEQGWSAFLLMARREVSDRTGVTVRYDFFDDKDGFAFGTVADAVQKRQAFAIAPSYNLDEGLDLILELRLDWSDRDAWLDRDGQPTVRSLTVALEMIYSF